MANEVIELPTENRATSLALTRDGVEELKRNRALLMEFVKSQLREDVDYGKVPGTDKPSLYKPGAEKMRTLFSLQTETTLVEKDLDRPNNFAMFTYKTTVRDRNGTLLATCDGSCNSQEKKYKERAIYKWVNDKRVKTGTETTPVYDVMNTLQKMAQKRSFVGAVILATGASDFFTQDIDDAEDAAAIGALKPEPPATVKATIPTATSAVSQHQADPKAAAASAAAPNCDLCGTQLRLTRNQDAYSCPNWKDQSRGRHSYKAIEGDK